MVRTPDWLKATYHSAWDDLVSYDLGFYGRFTGYVYELKTTQPVSRIVRLYNRLTGELIDSTTSSGNGYYRLNTNYNSEHYIIALDDDSGVQYNLRSLDRMIPEEVV